jgi:serine/threonine protein phosphatase PrpC
MITAEPDITLTQLQEGDRFFILACDGVWDCLSNQQAVRFSTYFNSVCE